MSYQVLARKWRPKTFAELVGQEHVVTALTIALTSKRLHHAYLLTGTRGVGKTTIARLLAKSLNCITNGVTATPCGTCAACVDIDAGRFVDLLELDAASNTGVDNMREILDNARYAPTVGRYKVYLIDEVHMLSKSAFNSMLKTLEEPPEATTIVLLTARPYALLPTIRSRVLHFRFPGMASAVRVEGWEAWLGDYRAWLRRLGEGVAAGRAAADGIFTLYGLVARYASMLDKASEAEGVRRKEGVAQALDDDEIAALEAEISVGLRLRMFAGIEEATSAHARELLEAGDAGARRPLAAAVDSLERSAGLLRVNLNDAAALEDFLLASLRIWTRR